LHYECLRLGAYTYDNAGNRKARTDKRLGTTLTFTVDNIYQLTKAVQGTTTKETYSYDLVGNRLSSKHPPADKCRHALTNTFFQSEKR
jgi:YD repeat-containing protein